MPSLQDSPTSRLVAGTDEEPNWDKLLNEAQFVALKISDPAVPAKTPLTHSKLSSTGRLRKFSLFSLLTVRSSAKLSHYSPGEAIDSPSALLLDTSKDNPENFLVKLTPEKSPSKSKKTPAEDLGLTASPTLENKCRGDASDSGNISVNEKRIEEVDGTEDKSGNNKFDEVVKNPKNILSEKKKFKEGKEAVKSNQKDNKMTTPVRKSQSKENTRPGVISGLRKGPSLTSNVKAVTKPKFGVKQPSTEVKKPLAVVRMPQSESKKPPVSRRLSTTPSVPAAGSQQGEAVTKTLQFTPKSSGPRVVSRRESSSAVKAPASSIPAERAAQFKLPARTAEAHLKKTVVPPRAGRLQPTRLALKPGPAAGPGAATNTSLVRPRAPPLKPPSSDTEAAAASALPKPKTSGLPRSGLQRPALYRQGSVIKSNQLGSVIKSNQLMI